MRGTTIAFTLAGLLASPTIVSGQEAGWDPTRVYASRTSLEQLERRFEAAAESPAYSSVLRAEARAEAAKLRERLRTGDFRPGDRVLLTVEREAALSDTFTVAQERHIELPGLGSVPLDGLLRSEVEQHLRVFVSRYVRSAVVRARPFVRVSITGEVQAPGFYAVPSDVVLSDALLFARGITATARVTDVTIHRNDVVLWDSDELTDVVEGGRTLDQLDIRSGDRIEVGRRGGGVAGLGGLEGPLRALSMLLAIPLTIVGLIAIF